MQVYSACMCGNILNYEFILAAGCWWFIFHAQVDKVDIILVPFFTHKTKRKKNLHLHPVSRLRCKMSVTSFLCIAAGHERGHSPAQKAKVPE